MSVLDVASVADQIALRIRTLDHGLRAAAKSNPYLFAGAATALGIALASGLLPAVARLLPTASRALPAVLKVATSRAGRTVLTALSGAALARRLES